MFIEECLPERLLTIKRINIMKHFVHEDKIVAGVRVAVGAVYVGKPKDCVRYIAANNYSRGKNPELVAA